MNTEKENYQDNNSQDYNREANNNEDNRGGYYRSNNNDNNYQNNNRSNNYRSSSRPYNNNYNNRRSYDGGNNRSYNSSYDNNRRNDNYSGGSYNNRGGDGAKKTFTRNSGGGSYNRPNNNYRDNNRNYRDGNNEGYQGNRGYNNSGYNRDYSGGQRSYNNNYQRGESDYRNEDGRSRRPRINRDYDNSNNRGYNNNYGNNSYGNNNYNNRDRGGYNRGGGQRRYNNNYNNDGYNNRRNNDYDPNAKYSQKKQIEYKEASVNPDEALRLNKYLANAGVCSRREADEFITAGAVAVNNEIVTELGTKVKRSDEVRFNGDVVSIERKMYVLLNKPKDFVTTMDDPEERRTVMDLVKDACEERIYPVGRLDKKTTGVLLLTNDGDLASKLTHPKFDKKKIYQVTTDRNVSKGDLDKILEGIELTDGVIKADSVGYTDPRKSNQVGIEIHSGKNRIVRRIFETLGYKVIKLDRVYFAGLTKKSLRRGEWRYLTQQEVNFLKMGSFE